MVQTYLLDTNTAGASSAAALTSSSGFDVDFAVLAGHQVSISARVTDAYSSTPLSIAIYDPNGVMVPASTSYGFVSGQGTGTSANFIASTSGEYTAVVKGVYAYTTAQNVAVSAMESGLPATYLTALHLEAPASGASSADTSSPAATPANFTWTDTVSSQSGSDAGQSYGGPVNYLHWQYIWPNQDGVNVNALASSVFIKGGAGTDALKAAGGSNVLDGNTGSNFLVGSNGGDGGTDTFFVDGRGATTWSTAVNFHQGDSLTIWGFNEGQSAFQWAANDGAYGYQGATIHAETAGSGTAVNASFTFAGLSLADAQNKLVITAGNADGIGYLHAAYVG